ncbi:uncharacterized protein LOC113346359 [Papaver somniferum]|uniref:uncharacterized protein LOC113346359 n=1 Tax=Papaver somniferum TaxID=3469 RepID=UPI000E703375|nr:uncharacterized protein LOC113346359 [Papaver somniferum]
MRQSDVSNTFLHGTLTGDVYVEQPPGFVYFEFPSHVCHLNMSLYSLKQAPRAWFDKFSGFLLSYGFTQSICDHSMFFHSKAGVKMILLVYVDDIILVGNSDSNLTSFISTLKTQFALKDLGPLSYFLGIEPKLDTSTNSLLLTQNKYSIELLKKFDMLECKPCTSPVASGRRASLYDGTLLEDSAYYRSLVGALQYLTLTRPDVSFLVNYVAQFMHQPTDVHLQLAKRILRFIKGSLGTGITLVGGDCSSITAFTDSDWAGFPDSRNTTSGYCVFLGQNLVAWSSKKQPTQSHSSTKAEYKALSVAASEIRWISYIMDELGDHIRYPCTMFCDNIGAGSLTANPICHARTKHVELDYHSVRSLVMLGFSTVRYIPSLQNIVDLFTKGLPKQLFTKLQDKLLHFHSVQIKGDCKNKKVFS